MDNTHIIHNAPNGADLFRSVAGNNSNPAHIVFEFVDDSISNLLANWGRPGLLPNIDITLEDHGAYVEVTVKDGGTGILDLDNALTISGRLCPETHLNEWGMGIKLALASADSGPGQMWTIQTRTEEDAALGRYKLICSPYGINTMTWSEELGKGDIEGETGTVIRFRCPKPLFETLSPVAKKVKPEFEELVDIVKEELRFTYGGILARGDIWFELTAVDESGTRTKTLINSPLVPRWLPDTVEKLNGVKVDLGGGEVAIDCKYGLIEGSEENVKYYKANMASSGVEISVNGRTFERGLYTRIFGEALHPSQNRFLAQIDLKSSDPAALPSTKASKTAFREGDPRLEKLFEWIRKNVTRPDKDCRSREKKLVDLLMDKKKAEPGVLRVTEEEGAYQTIGLKTKMDLFVSGANGVTIYEAKATGSKAENLYQLRLYWDGCAMDGKPANEGILIAERHPEEVRQLVELLNRQKDLTGKPYRFRLATWAQEGIDPNSI